MDNTPTTENKWKYEWYPEIKDRNSDHPAYRLEFHQWEGKPETWKLEKRNFLFPKDKWDELMNESTDSVAESLMGREVHPYTLLEDKVLPNHCIPNKKWLKWMVDALNEKALKDDINNRSGNKNII
jgi:hypothetical protein